MEDFSASASLIGRLSRGQRVIATSWGLESWQEYIALPEQDLVGCPGCVLELFCKCRESLKSWRVILLQYDAAGGLPQARLRHLLRSASSRSRLGALT